MVMNQRLAIILLFACLSQQRSTCQTSPFPVGQVPSRAVGEAPQQSPKYIQGGFNLPNGWRITPAGKAIATIEDLVLNTVVSPDGKIIVATHSGHLPHGIDVTDVKPRTLVQQIPLKTTWLGFAWSSDGHTLYVSSGKMLCMALNEIIWKSVKGADSPMPPSVHRFRPLIDAGDMIVKDDD